MVAVGELLASVVLKMVCGKLAKITLNATLNEISLQLKFSKDLESIKGKLLSIQSVLKDVERQSSKQESVRDWLKKLKAVAYDLEDMLLLSPGPQPTRVRIEELLERLKMPRKIKTMRKTIEEIVDNRKIFNLSEDVSIDDGEMIKKRETISLTSEVTVGRMWLECSPQ
nr:unnamed protein product [Digitaria exilis]